MIVLAAFIFSCGGQWYVLQGIAWANMIREYSQMVPLDQAIQMTFSGQYPCAICKAIAEKKQTENDKACSFDKHEKKFFSSIEIAVANPCDASFLYPDFTNSFRSRTEIPPTPPPRLSLS
jgi:hypothetical protein